MAAKNNVIDASELNRAIAEYAKTTTRAWPEIMNQRAANVIRRMLEIIPPKPGEEQATRANVRNELTEELAVKVRLATSGKRKGQFLRVGSKHFSRRRTKGKDRSLRRVHLIAQAARRKAGKKGLYGESMRLYAAKMVQSRQVGVGWIKAMLIPLARGLQPFIRYKIPARYTSRISRWVGSVGYGIVRPATMWQINPVAILENDTNFPGTSAGRAAHKLLQNALRIAISAETAELISHMRRKSGDAADRFNRR